MKHLIFLLLISALSYGQKTADTLYIYFKQDKYQVKEEYSNRINEPQAYYHFYLDDSIYFNNEIKFLSNKYLNYDRLEAGIVADVRTVKKSFLKRNKKKIINIVDLRKVGKANFLKHYSALNYYIIDEAEISKNKVVLREVFLATWFGMPPD